ncbi:hypothetical protein QOT17_004950 [Balamuthia mandrillaris]
MAMYSGPLDLAGRQAHLEVPALNATTEEVNQKHIRNVLQRLHKAVTPLNNDLRGRRALKKTTPSKTKRMGVERLKHNASERKRKLVFNTKLEELACVIPDLPPSPTKRQVVEGAAQHIRELQTEHLLHQQKVRDMERSFTHALQNQHLPSSRVQHHLRPPEHSVYRQSPVASANGCPAPILPPLHVVLSHEFSSSCLTLHQKSSNKMQSTSKNLNDLPPLDIPPSHVFFIEKALRNRGRKETREHDLEQPQPQQSYTTQQ